MTPMASGGNSPDTPTTPVVRLTEAAPSPQTCVDPLSLEDDCPRGKGMNHVIEGPIPHRTVRRIGRSHNERVVPGDGARREVDDDGCEVVVVFRIAHK